MLLLLLALGGAAVPPSPIDTVPRASVRRPAPDDSTARTDSSRARRLESVIVSAVRAADAPVPQSTIGAAAIARSYTGQDVPLVLQQAPAISTYSESGSQWNYSYFRLRGIGQSRINVTLDGIPLNEPEDQQVYFSDFPDLASSIRSVQIQRGVGTSNYGQSSFGGSVNLESEALANSRRGGEVQLGGGSFGAARGAVEYRSGQLANRTAFYGRVSNQRADGYRVGSSHAGNSQFVSGGWFGDRDVVKVTLLTGVESNGQAYSAVSDSILRRDPRYNPIAGVGDRFRESMGALSYTHAINAAASIATTLYGFDAGGSYDYPSGGPQPAYRFKLHSRWGGLVSAAHVAAGALALDAGVHASTYVRDHMFDARPDLETPGYGNRGYKDEGSAFAKSSWTAGAVTLFGDVQVREAAFRYRPTPGSTTPSARTSWTFVNPRAGITWRAAPALSVFASVGSTGREPTRADLLAGADDVAPEDADSLLPLSRVRPERVVDYELGTDVALGALSLRANAYAMEFRDEIALTGAATPLGYDVRRNVGTSYRRGVELDASLRVDPRVTLAANVAASDNLIRTVRDESAGAVLHDVEPVLTPRLLSGQQVTWRALPWATLAVDGRYQSRSFLAPTHDERLTAPPFYVLDGGATFTVRGHSLLVQGRNLLDRRAYPSGNVSSHGVPRYFILAPRNAEVTARIAF